MSCRLLNQIFRLSKINNLYPILHEIMLNAFPNNNSLLKNTSTSFYTILASNIYKNHYLAKQKNAMKYAACLESDKNCNQQVNKSKDCKTKKKVPKLKYKKIRICNSEDKCKEKMICICMPISKSKLKLNDEEPQKNGEFIKKCPSMFCRQQSKPSCSLAGYSNKPSKYSAFERKSSPSTYMMKPCNSTNYCAPFQQSITTNYKEPSKKLSPMYCTISKQSGTTNSYASSQKIGLTNSCAKSKKPGSTYIRTPSKQLKLSSTGVSSKQTGKYQTK